MKNERKLPQLDDLPCWYEPFLKNDTTVGIRIRREIFPELATVPWDTAPIVSFLTKKYSDLKSFTQPGEGSWGFNGVFTGGQSSDPNWVVWEFKLPNIKGEFDDPAYPRTHIAIRATLYMFCLTCRYLVTDMLDQSAKQLIIIDHVSLPERGHHASGSLSAILTPSVLPWIAGQEEGHVKALQEAMRTAHGFMWDGAGRSDRFGARIGHPKWIYLDVPGDACDLSPDNNANNDMDYGYTLVPHNVDSGPQQLTFVVALAKLHDLIRGAGF